MGGELKPGRLLVASERLFDDNFHQTVVLLCRYDPELGALGIVVNRPTEIVVGGVLPKIAEGRVETLWVGGPVDAQSLWVVHRRGDLVDPGEPVIDGVWFGSSPYLIKRILATTAPDPDGALFRLFVGYAGWDVGQLEAELEEGAWNVVPTGSPTLFAGRPIRLWPEMKLRALLPCAREPELLTNSWLN